MPPEDALPEPEYFSQSKKNYANFFENHLHRRFDLLFLGCGGPSSPGNKFYRLLRSRTPGRPRPGFHQQCCEPGTGKHDHCHGQHFSHCPDGRERQCEHPWRRLHDQHEQFRPGVFHRGGLCFDLQPKDSERQCDWWNRLRERRRRCRARGGDFRGQRNLLWRRRSCQQHRAGRGARHFSTAGDPKWRGFSEQRRPRWKLAPLGGG